MEKTNRQGKVVTIQSFQVSIQKKSEQISRTEQLYGPFFVSNYIDTLEEFFVVSGQQIICAYRDKTKIEDAFKHIKSFLKIRPFYVYQEAHIRAVYSTCVLSYLSK